MNKQKKGVPISNVQSMLGYRCLESTQIYIHISNKTVIDPLPTKKPEVLKMSTKTISTTKVGGIPATIPIPFFSPFIKSSGIGHRESNSKPTI